jgi:hypothetical protein
MEAEFEFDFSRYPELGPDAGADWAIESLSPRRDPPWWIAGVVTGLVAAAALVWWALENVGFQGMSPVERAYARLVRFGSWLGRPLRVSDTPGEWSRSVSAAAPEAEEPIGRIVDLYVEARFARGDSTAGGARSAWREVRPLLWRGWFRRVTSGISRRAV